MCCCSCVNSASVKAAFWRSLSKIVCIALPVSRDSDMAISPLIRHSSDGCSSCSHWTTQLEQLAQGSGRTCDVGHILEKIYVRAEQQVVARSLPLGSVSVVGQTRCAGCRFQKTLSAVTRRSPVHQATFCGAARSGFWARAPVPVLPTRLSVLISVEAGPRRSYIRTPRWRRRRAPQ